MNKSDCVKAEKHYHDRRNEKIAPKTIKILMYILKGKWNYLYKCNVLFIIFFIEKSICNILLEKYCRSTLISSTSCRTFFKFVDQGLDFLIGFFWYIRLLSSALILLMILTLHWNDAWFTAQKTWNHNSNENFQQKYLLGGGFHSTVNIELNIQV